jgi:hypothetical protein
MPNRETKPNRRTGERKQPREAGERAQRSLSARAERSLKEADRLVIGNPGAPAHERAMAKLERAKVSALLHLADAIRETRAADGPPRA